MLDGNVLREADDEKDLGVIISKDMKFKGNISAQIRKANRTLGMIKRNFKYINREIFQNLYSTLVRPHLEFDAPVWSPWQQGEQDRLEQVQRRATKLVGEIRNCSYEERLSYLNLWTTEARRRRGDMITVFKIMRNLVDNSPANLRLSEVTRTRGHIMKLAKNTSRLDIRRHFFFNRVQNEWNGLGAHVVESTTVDGFKKAYDRHSAIVTNFLASKV